MGDLDNSPRSEADRMGERSKHVLAAIAERERVDPLSVGRPLHDGIDPDALDGLFRPNTVDGRVEFTALGNGAVVSSDGAVDRSVANE